MSAAQTTTPRSSTATSSALPAFRSLSVAIARGFWRDRASVFFAVIFPLMFLVLFGGIFADQGSSEIDLVQVGDVPVLEQLPPGAAEAFDDNAPLIRSSSPCADASLRSCCRSSASASARSWRSSARSYTLVGTSPSGGKIRPRSPPTSVRGWTTPAC